MELVIIFFIIIKIVLMSLEINELKQSLAEAKEKMTKVGADVTRLHQKIEEISGQLPTQEEWDEVKSLANELKTGLGAIDDATPEE